MYEGMPLRRHQRGHSLLSFAALLMIVASIFMTALAPQRTIAIGTSEIIDLSNAARSQNGLAPFDYNGQLAAAAQAKADHMKANGYFEHTAPDGTTGWFFIAQQGYSYITAGENLAATNESSTAVVDGWMNSPGHRANLLNPQFTEVGYGIVFFGQYLQYQNVYFVVALYGQPIVRVEQPEPIAVAPNTTTTLTPTNPTTEPTAQIAPSQPSENSSNNETEQTPIVSGNSANTSPPDGSTSGGLTVAKSNPFISIPTHITNIVLGIGVLLLLAGSILEIRHFLHTRTIIHHAPRAH